MNSKYFLIFAVIFLFLSFVSAGWFQDLFQQTQLCGDRSFDGECSAIQPYYCSEGVLVENASFCRCSENMTVEGEKCVSSYMNSSSKQITLKYVLKGNEGKINYTVYEGLFDYLASLPRFIIYEGNQTPFRKDFKLRNINEPFQRELLLPLVVEIQNSEKDKENQARIAISLVQNIGFGNSNKTIIFGNNVLNYSRYPYEVLYDEQGVCGEKTELMAFLLRELGYSTGIFYYRAEDHEAFGIKCPREQRIENTSYCFVETTGPSIITNSQNKYVGNVELNSEPEVIDISDGIALENNLEEYKDAKTIIKLNNIIEEQGKLNIFRYTRFKKLREKYGLE